MANRENDFIFCPICEIMVLFFESKSQIDPTDGKPLRICTECGIAVINQVAAGAD